MVCATYIWGCNSRSNRMPRATPQPTIRTRYAKFLPAFAVVGPELPAAKTKLPFEVPKGQGAIVMENYKPGTYYVYFGPKIVGGSRDSTYI